MSAARWERLDRVFSGALQLPPEARAAFVADETRDDAALRVEVLSLLSAENASDTFMTTTAFERLAQVVGTEGWTLVPGERLGAYGILNLIGRGGASEVWRARDERLQRDVAIKVLLPHLSDDPHRLRRFADEARTVGSLNHPNILAIYDLGEHGAIPFFVSELLDGRSLRARLESGDVPVAEAVAIAVGVTRGLAAAHAQGIVHRDLKPENVFLTRTGVVKILDFGVAKLRRTFDDEGAGGRTLDGMILGTAGYMSPEQVRGDPTDARADLFALGVMLYELLTGTAPFTRASVIESLHAILTADPPDPGGVRPIPPDLLRIVMRLLHKDRDQRFQSAADLLWALEQAAVTRDAIGQGSTRSPRPPPSRLARFGTYGLALAVLLASALWIVRPREVSPAAESDVTRFSLVLPPGVGLASAPAVSPDGRRIAFVGSSVSGNQLFIWAFDDFTPRTVDGSDGARQPFWSPDGRWVGFFSRGRVMKVSVDGGAPVVVEDDNLAATGMRWTERGGAWGSGGWLVYGASVAPPALFAAPAAGGARVPATVLPADRTVLGHRFPVFLPDGRHFLYQVRARAAEDRGVFVGTLGGASVPSGRLLDVESNAIYAATADGAGVLLYVANGRIEAQRFDPARLSMVGPARALSIEAGGETMFQPAAIGASSRVLAYARQFVTGVQLKSVGPGGGAPALVNDRHEQLWPRLSGDGTRLAWLQVHYQEGADIWVEDLARHTRTRVTTTPGREMGHVWSPDGRRLAYVYDLDEPGHLRLAAADGSGTSQDVRCPRAYCAPTDWSSDGKELIVNSIEKDGVDVWAIAIAPGGASRPLLQTRFTERDARLSPDRQWIAYVSDEAGRSEISVRRVDGSARRYTVSAGGGDQVVWQRDGRALYYVGPNGQLRKVPIESSGDGLRFASPVELPIAIGSGHSTTQEYDVASDGRIYYIDAAVPPPPTEIRIVLGWQALLK